MSSPPWTAALLRAHAQDAVELELFTIPAICAYYSIHQRCLRGGEAGRGRDSDRRR